MSAENELCVTTTDGKYTVILSKEGRLQALRYGEPWRDCVGDNLILTLAQDIEDLSRRLRKAEETISAYAEQAIDDGNI